MKLLILTQAVDKNDPVLGFFHRWVEEFAKRFEKVTVICLKMGEYHLPDNVKVLSLGKEEGRSVFKYLFRFYKYLWGERKEYDAVFVHMNQEYVLLAGDVWRVMGKRVYLWRNHAKGGALTDIVGLLSHKVFYTSPSSYTARFKNAVQLPVGVDTEFFHPDSAVQRESNSVLFLGRISPVKKVVEFIDWAKGKDYKVTIAGPVAGVDEEYWQEVQKRMTSNMSYVGPVNQEQARRLYQSHEIYANFTPVGSFDKTIFEAMACGAKLVTHNPEAERSALADDNSLNHLMARLEQEMS